MDRLCVVIYETSDVTRKLLHDVLVSHAIAQNIEIVIRWLKRPLQESAVHDACCEAQIAFVNSSDTEDAVQIGAWLRRSNATCALVYYGSETPQTVPDAISYFSKLIYATPVRYIHQPSPEAFGELLHGASAAGSDRACFCWETKGMRYRIPYESIQYFRSDRNYVYIHLQNGTEYAFLGKLSYLEKQMSREQFIRIHQSYLVNRSEIIAVDKQKKTVHLRSKDELFISKAHYKETLASCGIL